MSGGGGYSRAPAHQNKVAFKHNKNSKKTRKIEAIPNVGVCKRCHDIIEWRKKYRKYKPLTKAGKCSDCHKYAVRFAYHHLCTPCSNKKQVCPKCMKHKDIWGLDEAEATELAAELEYLRETRGQIPGIPERERRAMIRSLEKEAAGDTGESAAADGEEAEAEDDGEGVPLEDVEGEEGEDGEEEEDAEEAEDDAAPAAAAGAGGKKAATKKSSPAAVEEDEEDDASLGGPVEGDPSFKAAMKESDEVNAVLSRALAAAKRKMANL